MFTRNLKKFSVLVLCSLLLSAIAVGCKSKEINPEPSPESGDETPAR